MVFGGARRRDHRVTHNRVPWRSTMRLALSWALTLSILTGGEGYQWRYELEGSWLD